ncbi:MAG: sigma-70 family RNA polymerase sigma factor [Bryobacterales bacterium]|jgi:RNA polymerase sigma-70 factor (ECF subfamily)|nr:sigma-70 family RNA polymerase sigma factor [Bryobacterales bacterium]
MQSYTGQGAAQAARTFRSESTVDIDEADDPREVDQDLICDTLPTTDLLRAIVVRIRRNDDDAKKQLYQVFNRGIRFQLVRHLGTADIEDKVHDTFLIVLQAIMRDDLRNPESLLGYIRTVVRRQIANYIERAMLRRREHPVFMEVEGGHRMADPEQRLLHAERLRLMRQILSELSPRDREVLVRFYIEEMPQEQICEQMGLSMNQFRLLKSRAKARFSELGKRQLRPKVLTRYQSAAS